MKTLGSESMILAGDTWGSAPSKFTARLKTVFERLTHKDFEGALDARLRLLFSEET